MRRIKAGSLDKKKKHVQIERGIIRKELRFTPEQILITGSPSTLFSLDKNITFSFRKYSLRKFPERQ